MEQDYVDSILDQWARERPDLDMSPIGIVGRVYRLSRIIEHRLGSTFDFFEISRGSFDVLAALRRAGPPHRLSPTELHNSLLITSGAMTNRIDRLEEGGLVMRQPSPEDRRGLLVGLTASGKRLVDAVTTDMAKAEHDLLTALEPGEQQQLANLMKTILISLDDIPPATKGNGPAT